MTTRRSNRDRRHGTFGSILDLTPGAVVRPPHLPSFSLFRAHRPANCMIVVVAAARFHDHSFCCTRRGCVSVPSRGARAEWLRLCLYTGPPQCPSLHAAAQPRPQALSFESCLASHLPCEYCLPACLRSPSPSTPCPAPTRFHPHRRLSRRQLRSSLHLYIHDDEQCSAGKVEDKERERRSRKRRRAISTCEGRGIHQTRSGAPQLGAVF
jgi:hypothetical protein